MNIYFYSPLELCPSNTAAGFFEPKIVFLCRDAKIPSAHVIFFIPCLEAERM